jgi:hypothetical protein
MKRKLLSMSAAALLVLGVAAPVQAASQQQVKHDPNQGYNIVVSGVATIKNAKGAQLYSEPNTANKVNRVLPNGSAWKVSQVVNNGFLWYKVGRNQWILAYDANLAYNAPTTNTPATKTDTKSDAKASDNTKTETKTTESKDTKTAESKDTKSEAKPTTPAKTETKTTTPALKTEPIQGIATVTYRTPIVVWAEPGAHPTKRYLPRNSQWRYFKIAQTADGENWYNLGGNQWVPQKYINQNQDPHIGHYSDASLPVVNGMLVKRQVVTINNTKGKGAYVVDRNGKSTGRLLPNGSRWQSFGFINNGELLLNLGGNQWVEGYLVK